MIWLAILSPLRAAWAFLRTLPPLVIACALLTLFAGWQWHSANMANDRTARATQSIARIVAASKHAEVAARRAADAIDKRNATITKDANDAYRIATADSRDRIADYVRRNRVRPAQDCGLAGNAGVPTAAPDSRQPEGPGDDAVVVSRADFDAVTQNSLRLKNAVDWAAQ